MFPRLLHTLAAVGLALSSVACAPYPRDSDDSTRQAEEFGMRVGASADPPYVVISPDESVSGFDAEIVERFARSHNLRVRWVVGGHESLMAQLEASRLHLVIGGHAKDSPWESRAGWSKAIPVRATQHSSLALRRFAVPPGENAWHVLLDRYLVTDESAR